MDPLMEQEFARVRALAFEPYTLFRVRPIAGRYVNVTQEGFRAGRSPAVWPPDPRALNVFVFGGSTTFGYGVADAETIPSQLSDELAARLPGQPIATYNFATPNYVAIQERIRFEQLLLSGHAPRIAVFIDGFDEFVAPYYAPLMFEPFERALSRNAGGFLSRLSSRPKRPEQQLPDVAAAIELYLGNMALIRAACQPFNVRPLFVWQPVPCYQYAHAAGNALEHGSGAAVLESVRAGYELMNTRRSALAKDFLWLADIQAGKSERLYVDADHYTPAFSREIASRIASHVVDSGS